MDILTQDQLNIIKYVRYHHPIGHVVYQYHIICYIREEYHLMYHDGFEKENQKLHHVCGLIDGGYVKLETHFVIRKDNDPSAKQLVFILTNKGLDVKNSLADIEKL